MIATLTSELPEEYKPKRADTIRSVLSVGGLLVLADLSLRRNGFGQTIDYFLPVALKELREGYTEEVERELVEASKVIPQFVETFFPKMVNFIIQEAQVGHRQ